MIKTNYSRFFFHLSPWLVLSGIWGVYGTLCIRHTMQNLPTTPVYTISSEIAQSLNQMVLDTSDGEPSHDSTDDISVSDDIALLPVGPVNEHISLDI